MDNLNKSKEKLISELQELQQENKTFKALFDKDTTGRKQTNQELNNANQELAFQNREKDKRADELIIANKELHFQSKEKKKRVTENNKLHKLILELKQAEVKIHESEEKFSKAFMISPNAITITNPKGGKFIEVNDAFTSIVGYTREEVLADSLEGIKFWGTDKDRIQVVNELLEGRVVAGKEFIFRKKNGELITGLFSAQIIQLNNEPYILSSINDITGRKKAEEELKSAKSLLDAVVDSSPFAMWISDREGLLIRSNRSLRESLNLTDEQLIGKYNVLKDVNLEMQGVMPLVMAVFENYTPARFIIPWNASDAGDVDFKDGRNLYIDVSIFPIRDNNGELTNVVCQWVDISERMLADEKIKNTYDAFISILDAYPGILKIIDPETYEIILVNKTFADKLPQYGKGKKCYEVFYELTSPCSFCTNEIIKNNSRQPYSWENYNPVTKTDYLHTDQLIKWPDGRNVRYEIAIDISERKKAEDLLRITLENLERSNHELEQFAYVASHDLQEPLRMVSSYTQLLERRYKDKLDQDANEFIQYAVDGANRMQKLINDLLDYSRITSRGKELTIVDTSQVLGQTISNLQESIIENTAIITNDDLPKVKADESQILRVFQNLIQNALKFKNKAELPKIHISCKKKNDFYEFSVRDNGIGMDMQYLDRVFTIFQRLHTKEEYPGTGIGLSICKRIIERHGGKIWFDSKENEGTTFYFTLKI